MQTFGERIKELRLARKLSIEDLAKALADKYGVRISKSSISRWENNQASPDITDGNILADYFNVSLDWLVGNKEMNVSEKVRTVAAHLDDKDITDEEMEAILTFIDLLSKKK